MNAKKQKNLDFFQNKLEEFLKDPKLKHKFLVIAEEEVKGSFDSFAVAIEFASSNFSPEEFIVQQVIGEGETVNFIRAAV